VIENFVETKN